MGRYVEWSDVVDRYSLLDSLGGAAEVGSTYIQYCEAMVDGKLACLFTPPFSNNNLTVKDLVIDEVFLKASRTRDKTYDKVNESLMERYKGLLGGDSKMVDLAGTILSSGTVGCQDTSGATPIYGEVGSGDRWEGDIKWSGSC